MEKERVLKVLKDLSSNDVTKYEIKTITFPTWDSYDRHGDRFRVEVNGKLTILGEEEAISKLDSSKKMKLLTQDMLIDIYNQGYSMILFGNTEYYTERLRIKDKEIIGYNEPLVFYLQDDELSIAASSLINYVRENDINLREISEADLTGALRKYQKGKELTK